MSPYDTSKPAVPPDDALVNPLSYVQRVLQARVYDVAIESPLEPAPDLSRRLGNSVWLKREDLQPVFSFKLRGAYNKMAGLSAAELGRGVIAASAGNHAQGVALAAQKLNCRAVIVMPVTTPEMKVRAVAGRGPRWCCMATPTTPPAKRRDGSRLNGATASFTRSTTPT